MTRPRRAVLKSPRPIEWPVLQLQLLAIMRSSVQRETPNGARPTWPPFTPTIVGVEGAGVVAVAGVVAEVALVVTVAEAGLILVGVECHSIMANLSLHGIVASSSLNIVLGTGLLGRRQLERELRLVHSLTVMSMMP